MDYHKVSVKLFDFFYRKLYKNGNFNLDLSVNNQRKMVDNFFKMLSVYYPIDSVGINFLISYYSFAFSMFADKITKRKISLNWIIGKKMFERWRNRSDGHQYYVDKFLSDHNINLDIVKADLYEEKVLEDGLDPVEELEKLRFSGEARLYNCLLNTTLYNHRSVNCLSCENKFACKKLLKQKYPGLSKKRGYESPIR